MKKLAFLLTALTLSTAAMAEIKCQGAKYGVVITEDGGVTFANYSIDKKMNDGADVTVDKFTQDDDFLNLSVSVDAVPKSLRVTALKTGGKTYKGKIEFKKVMQDVTCTK